METQYSNREIDMMQSEIHQKLDLILSQTTKTNGRVSNLESEVTNLYRWKAYIAGGGAVILFLFPMLSWIYFGQIQEIKAEVQSATVKP